MTIHFSLIGNDGNPRLQQEFWQEAQRWTNDSQEATERLRELVEKLDYSVTKVELQVTVESNAERCALETDGGRILGGRHASESR